MARRCWHAVGRFEARSRKPRGGCSAVDRYPRWRNKSRELRVAMSSPDRYRTVIEYLGAQRVHDLSSLELERIRATMAVIPSDVSSVLDVGCGDGRILERLPERLN